MKKTFNGKTYNTYTGKMCGTKWVKDYELPGESYISKITLYEREKGGYFLLLNSLKIVNGFYMGTWEEIVPLSKEEFDKWMTEPDVREIPQRNKIMTNHNIN